MSKFQRTRRAIIKRRSIIRDDYDLSCLPSNPSPIDWNALGIEEETDTPDRRDNCPIVLPYNRKPEQPDYSV